MAKDIKVQMKVAFIRRVCGLILNIVSCSVYIVFFIFL